MLGKMYPLRVLLKRTMALTRLEKGIQPCARPTVYLDYNWRVPIQPFRLNRCKAPGSIFTSRGTKISTLSFVSRGTKDCLTSVIFTLAVQRRHREADENQGFRCRLSHCNAKTGFTVALPTTRFAWLSPLHPPPLQKADSGDHRQVRAYANS